MQTMGKCTVCLNRRETGAVPACVANCSGSALHVVDINDPNSEVTWLLRDVGEHQVHTLRDFGNTPSVYYILKKARWLDLLPQECGDARRGPK